MEEGEYEYEYNEPETKVNIAVIDTDIRSDKLTKHVLYSIAGDDSRGSFACLRRYKEFSTLRYVLTCQWPGFYVPQIPQKQIIGNLAVDFIQVRKRLLEYFLKQITHYEFLYSSEAFQMFIRGPTDFLKPANEFKAVNYVSIAQNVRNAFPHYSDFQLNREHESQIEDAWQYFKTGLESLEKFEVVCKENLENFNGLRDQVKNLMIGVKEISAYYSEKYGGLKVEVFGREVTDNPYEDLLIWTRSDILDLRAMIEAIQLRQSLFKAKSKAQEKLDSERSKLLKIQSGKKTLGLVFSKKSKEEHISSAEVEIEQSEEEIQSISLILSIITGRLINGVIGDFKAIKTRSFEEIIKCFTENSIKEYSIFINEAKALDLNLS